MSVASDMAPYAIMYMGPVIGFLALSSFLWINLTLDTGRKQMARIVVRLFWAGAGAMSLAGVIQALGAIPYDELQHVYAALSGAVIGASGVVVVQHMASRDIVNARHSG